MSTQKDCWINEHDFRNDVDYIESRWKQVSIGTIELPLIDIGKGEPIVFVPVLEHLEFVYARQMHTLSKTRRVILYRRREMRTTEFGLGDRAEELHQVLDGLSLDAVNLIGHGEAAMVLFEFALRYPDRCRSLTIIAQGADNKIAPYPVTWLLRELYLRFPLEYVIPATFLRGMTINTLLAHTADNQTKPALSRRQIENQLCKIKQWQYVYKNSIIPVVHTFDIQKRVQRLTMPVLLINRADDPLAPEKKTRWLAQHLPNCAGYHIVSGRDHFFQYAKAGTVTPLIEAFLATGAARKGSTKQLQQ